MANGVIQIGYYKASWHPSFLLPAAMFVFLVALYVDNPGFFWTFRKKTQCKKKSKLKAIAQKVGTFLKLEKYVKSPEKTQNSR